MRKLIVVAVAAVSFLIGSTQVALAIRDPFPTCIRECSPIPELPEIPRPGPCNGALGGFC